jgi:pimeloyl-ACP methyl ester carboxylesterase
MTQAGDGWTHHEAQVNGIHLHYVEAGTGPLVVLLHGFPEFWYEWRHQIPALAAAGFRVVAPDLRGYNRSAKPAGIGSYRLEELVRDVAGLIRYLGAERAAVAGHDWGGLIAWYLAMLRPEVVDRLIVLNAPHPAAFARELRSPAQLLRSSYALFFQLPWLPEAVLRAGDFALLQRIFRTQPVRRGAYTGDDIQRYKDALRQPGALTAAINYYRAALRRSLVRAKRDVSRIDHPTLLIWGERDRYLNIRLTQGLEEWVPGIRVERIREASHWVPVDAPELVNRLLIDFLDER